MIHIIKNNKWAITTSIVCILFGVLTFLTLINQSFIELNDFNLQIILLIDALLLIIFFSLIVKTTYKVLKSKRKKEIGSKTSFKYISFFSITTLLPAIFVAVFSLILFNVGLQTFFNKKIKSVINNSAEVAKNYVEETRNTIEADILLMLIDINNKSGLYYDNPRGFLNLLGSQRLFRRLDEVHLLDSSGEAIMSNIIDPSVDFIPPTEQAILKSLEGKPVRIIDAISNRTSALVKLDNFIDTYLYVVKYMDPKLINYLQQTGEAISFYYLVQTQKNKIKVTFAIIYILVVSLLLFLSIIISANFASRLTKPIVNLIGASEKISIGDLNAKVPFIETDEEIKKLNVNFNSMIDKLKKQQDKLLISERHSAWESVARKLAHEIKNPLTPIQLSIDRIREKYLNKPLADDDKLTSYLDTITKQIKDIEHLVNEFSDFARMPKPLFKKVNLNQILSRAFKLHELSDPNIKFSLSKNNASYIIKGDEEQLNRVFINLVKNSIESIYENVSKNVDFKGKINIEIKEDSDYIYVTISDNGIGFSGVDKEKMLTPYFTTKKNGTGLGLAVVTKIINDHNSTITFNTIENGAKVNITLPKYYD